MTVLPITEADLDGVEDSGRHVQPEAGAAAERLSQLVFGFAATQTVLVSDEFGIFDTIAESTGALSAAELGSRLGLNADPLDRLLTGCCAFELLRKDAAGRYSLTDVSRLHLVKSSPGYMGGMFEHIRRDLYPLWQHLDSAVRENSPRWGMIPGADPRGPFETIYRTEEGIREFMEAMFSATYPAALEYARRFDFSRFRHIVDVGGASGAFFAAVLEAYPGIQGTIFDLPAVGPVARETMVRRGLGDRVRFVGGDFFSDPLPAGGDMYVLGFILHDWNRDRGTLLLQKIHGALPVGGAVFICEALFNEAKDGPPMTAMMDLNMLVATTGRERSASEYARGTPHHGFNARSTRNPRRHRGRRTRPRSCPRPRSSRRRPLLLRPVRRTPATGHLF